MNRITGLFAFGFHWVFGEFPIGGAADQCGRVLDPFFRHLRYQTGTRVFVRSGTIDDYFLIGRQVADAAIERGRGDVYGALDVLLFIDLRRPCVDEDSLAGVECLLGVGERDSRSIVVLVIIMRLGRARGRGRRRRDADRRRGIRTAGDKDKR